MINKATVDVGSNPTEIGFFFDVIIANLFNEEVSLIVDIDYDVLY